MFRNLMLNTWATITDGCEINYSVNGSDAVDFMFGRSPDYFEFGFDADALRNFLKLGGEALAKMDALHAEEQTTQPTSRNERDSEAPDT